MSDSDPENSTNMIYEYIYKIIQLNRNQQTPIAIQSNKKKELSLPVRLPKISIMRCISFSNTKLACALSM